MLKDGWHLARTGEEHGRTPQEGVGGENIPKSDSLWAEPYGILRGPVWLGRGFCLGQGGSGEEGSLKARQ